MKALLAILAVGMLGLTGLAGTAQAQDTSTPKPYVLDYCVFSGDKLGTMGKVQTEVYKGQEIKFCCKDCKKQFDKDPDAGIKKYNDAVKKSGKSSSTMDPNMKM